MTDIWTMECKECEGSGIDDCKGKFAGPTCPSCRIGCPCPHCKGSGGFNLGVKDCDKCASEKYSGCKYRPLTNAEVEEMKSAHDEVRMRNQINELSDWESPAFPIPSFEKAIFEGNWEYKGQPVKLLPREG